ncbi:erythritol/L-threitol dehydrogenase [Kushneria phosphatilytica]|uniref:Alcohol dehydrogenase catalytic domain-containing protein n=2 Tax=Kushneria phosphatilytica TaxID=657387 RepID=A0A1S1NSM7_9GAMM|nr:erythritol/L-threitol dehydrogenase [Kushneria phosphatilytica]QEL12659.1 alcohol dehydrogenase catalytic domain-containing protein [Kushneria phosphatilytica]
MQAVVCHAPEDYRLESVERPRPGPNEILLKIGACGICASDVKCRSGAEMFWGGEYQPGWVEAPVIAGHEFFGEVVELGPGAEEHFNIARGDRAIAEQIVPCGKCRYCDSGHYWMCEVHNIFGFQRQVADGGMAEYMLVPANARLHRIPQALSLAQSAFIEPLACGIHAVNRGDIQLDDTVVIAGAGPIGLAMVQVARLKTPKQLIVIDMLDARLELARKFGADVVLNPSRDDVGEEVRALTGGYGCDVYIEATGSPSGVRQGLDIIRKLGRFVEFSVFGKETTVDWSIIGDRKELDVRGAHLSPRTFPVAIDLMARGLVTTDGIVTHELPLAEFEEGFRMATAAESIKVLLIP